MKIINLKIPCISPERNGKIEYRDNIRILYLQTHDRNMDYDDC